MTVWHSSLEIPPGKGQLPEGALAVAAWVILNSKLSGNEQVVLNRPDFAQGSDAADKQHVVPVLPSTNVHDIVEKVRRAACPCSGDCRLWQLGLQLPPDGATGQSLATTQLLIAETQRSIWTWQELFPRTDTPRLLCVVSLRHGGIDVELSTSTAAIPTTRSQRLFQQFSHIAGPLVAVSPGAVVRDLDLVSPRDVADMRRWNAAAPVEPELACLHWAIEQHAVERPDAEAVRAWDASLTYGQLSATADHLAARLRRLGVGPETFVPVLFEKSAWAIAAMLAILQAGGAIVPLNPDHPRSRHQAILKDIDASVLVSSALHQDLARGLSDTVVVVDRTTFDNAAAAVHPTNNSSSSSQHNTNLSHDTRVAVEPSNPAFAVFTSGSTGQPKGIAVEHGAICTSIRDHGRVMRFGPQTRTIQFAAYTFDDSFSDIFTTLSFGGCICVPSDEDRLNDLAGCIVKLEANHACLTVTVAAQLQPRDVTGLKTLVVGGESVTARVVQQWADHVYLINSYGPAEASIFCSANPGMSRADDPINIGVGVGCTLHITEAENPNRLLPVGAIGELLIEGPILARCYIRNEAKTEQSFISDLAWAIPANGRGSGGPTRRFYRTGDLARYNEDGTIQVLGRKDTQVKVYGQRIELGEIEHHLRSVIPNCHEVAVEVLTPKTAWGTAAAATPVLAAFLQLSADAGSDSGISEPTSVEILPEWPDGAGDRLQELLPSYMIPAVCMKVQEMPIMVSGKLDRKALRSMASHLTTRDLAGHHPQGEGEGLPGPETDREELLQKLWAQTLDIDADLIKLGSSFFRLGGDSVAAMRLVANARDAAVKITVQRIFQHPTLREQASVIEFSYQGVGTSCWKNVDKFSLLGGVDRGLVLSHNSVSQLLAVDTALKAIQNHDLYITRDSISDIYPCSALQGGVMALSARNPGSYVAQMAYRLPPVVETARFKSAWDAVAQEHSILRTRIFQAASDSNLWQAVVDEPIPWSEANDTTLESYLDQDKQVPMTLGSRLARFAIVSSGSARWFVWKVHHAMFDDVSQRLLLRAVERAYHGLSPSPHLAFNVFIQHAADGAVGTAAAVEFWRQQLESPPPPSFPVLPDSDYLPSADQTISRSAEVEFLRGDTDVTPSTLLRAAWAILLAQYSESRDVIFGCTVNGRGVALDGVETVTGPTFATVPLRIPVDRDARIADFLQQLQQKYVDMMPYEQAGLQRIARWVPEARTAFHAQTLLVVQAVDVDDEQVGGGGDSLLGARELVGHSAGFLTNALTVECRPTTSSRLDMQFHFDSGVVPSVQVERLARQFEHIVRQLNRYGTTGEENSQEATIASLELIPEDDLQVLAHWNAATFADERVDQLLHYGFYEYLRLQPSSPAVQDYDNCLTYAELEERASRLAQALVAQFGIQTGRFVPLCMNKSVFVAVAVLAILKTGGALAMVDPLLPPERRKHIVSTCEPNFLLCCPSTQDFCCEQLLPIPAITVDQASIDALPPCPHQQVFQAGADPGDPGCIVFTSGSTGVSKGTVMSHRAWSTGTQKLGHFCGMKQLKPLRTLQFAALSFDICLFEITQTLSLGGCVCVLPESERTAEGAVRAINRFGANWAFLVPTFASMLDTRNNSIPTLRTLVFGGEVPPPALFSHYPPHVRLIQIYGPSETTPGTILNEHLDPKIPANVGRFIVGTGWIVDPDDHRRLTPIGGIGELLQAGPMVGSGYLSKSEMTAKVFVQPPPWASRFPSIEPGQQMYLTGDLFRYATDGSFIFSGRKDTQMKLRGQRLELGEIEYHLRQLVPQAKAIVADAIAPADQPDKKTLAAFVCLLHNEHDSIEDDDNNNNNNILLPATALDAISLNTLVSRAAAVLPRYMVPNVFLPIRRLPFVLVSRKIDRRALRAAGSSLNATSLRSYSIQAARQGSKPPKTATEQKLVDLVARVLRTEQEAIGTNDNFLLLGGDSIDAMRLTALAKAEGLSLTVAKILQKPILSELAQLADDQQRDSANNNCNSAHAEDNDATIAKWQHLKGDDALSPESIWAEALTQCPWLTSAEEIEDAYPCTGLQEGMYALSITRPGTYLSQHVFTASPLVDRKRLVAAWEKLYATLAILRTTIIQLPSSQLVQVITQGPLEWLPVGNDDLDTYLARDQSKPFALGDRLSRLALVPSSLSSSSQPPTVVWTAHHSLYDGFSVSLLTAALDSALRTEWDDVAAQRADFRQYIRYIGDTDPTAAREYWEGQFDHKRFAAFPPVLDNVGNEKTTTTVQPGHRDVVVETIPYVHKLRAVTAPSVIRAAWALTLARYNGSADVVFGATVSGRDAAVPNMADIIGPVFSTVPVATSVDYAKSIQELVESVQSQAVGMIEFQHLGLQNIARCGPAAAAAVGQVRNLIVIQPALFGDGQANDTLVKHRFADPNRTETHTYPVVVECDITPTGVHVYASCEHHELVGGAGELKRVIGVFAGLLGQMAQVTPETNISALLRRCQPDLDTLHAWNARVPPAVEKCIHQAIPFQARGPQLAVRACDGDVTYRDLDALSTRLAHCLVSMGVGPDRLVPLCFHKSLWAVVAVFAVMKAGGAPVFLNPDLSLDRLAGLVDFIDSDLLLTSAQALPQRNMGNNSKPVAKNIVDIDAGFVQGLADDDDDLAPSTLPEVQPHNLGFGVFTSGTTGVPKCILLEHRNLMTAASLYRENDDFRPGARVLQFASYAFDVSVKDMLGTLLYGCELYVPSEEDRMNNLVQYMQTHCITQAMLTPTIAGLFGPSDVPSLQVLALVGEKLTAGNMTTWAQAVHLINSYGPAETTVQSVCNSGLAADTDPRNIGHALGSNVWLVDPGDHNLLVPIGAVGEMVIEGPIVSRGYLKDIDKTAAVFISPPDWLPAARRNDTQNRLYKTGDLARLGSDGSLTFLGRDDAQVKLRGQRIELEEVEFHLKRQLPTSVGVVVEMVSLKGGGDSSLLAAFLHDKTIPVDHHDHEFGFVNPRSSKVLRDLDIAQVSRAVAETLPPYMLPSVFLAIPRIPLLPSAKTNRKLLRVLYANTEPATLATLSFASLARDSAKLQLVQQQPSSVTTTTTINRRLERLRAVVAKVLRLDEAAVALDQSFQELGGDSITAMRLLSAARAQGIGLTVMDILRRATIAHLDGVATDLDDPASAGLSGRRSALAPFHLVKDVVDDLNRLVAEVAARCRVFPDSIEDVFPCTPLQEALMALSIHQAGDYVARRRFQLPENVEFPRLLAALDAVAQRVPTLRSRIVQTGSGLYQVVIRGQIPITQDVDDVQEDGHMALDVENNTPIGLGEALNRFAVDRQRKVLTWVSHHATYDEVSATMLLKMVNRIYHGRPLDGPLSPVDYRLFIQHITQLSLESSQQFWSNQLRDASPDAFPFYAAGQSRNSTSMHEVKVTRRFRTTAVSAKPPTQAAIRAAWAIVLAAHTASDDVVFGTILSGRDAPVEGVDRMVGPTIATIPIRVRLDGGETIAALVGRLRTQATDMLPHEHFGLQRIRHISDEARHACDFCNLLVIHPPADEDEEDNEEEQRERDPPILKADDTHTASLPMNTYPLVLELHLPRTGGAEDGHEYALDVSFDPSIIDAARTERVVRQFQHVLTQLLLSQEPPHTTRTSPHEPLRMVKDIEVISAADREELWRWNAHIPTTVEDSLHSLIHKRSQAAPDAEAVVAWDGRLTYAELDQASSALAHEILARDDSVGSFVALCFEKSVWVAVAMLAVLKAGKAFAFLDPAYPVDRLRHITSLLDPVLAIASPTYLETCRGLVSNAMVLVPGCHTTAAVVNLPAVKVRPSDPICAVFSSGTTGVPKGAILSHRSYVTSNLRHAYITSLNAASRVLQFSSCSFDANVFEILTPLMMGGCVCIPHEANRNHDIDVEIRRMRVNWAFFTPAFAALLEPERVPTLKTIVLGGEAVSVQLVKTWSRQVSLHIAYGPSECSIFSTLTDPIDGNASPLNLGKACSGALWIVDPTNVDRLVPIGAPGELLLEGPNIGEGYIKNVTQTRAAFLEQAPTWFARDDSTTTTHGHKFYRTGDIVKYDTDGSLVWVGRKDSQAKIRGQRVELSEIENHLAPVPDLGHVVVTIPTVGPLCKRLVAVFSGEKNTAFQQQQQQQRAAVTATGGGLTLLDREDTRETAQRLINTAREKLSAVLPSHMIPNFWIPVEALPVLSSGKLDRKYVLAWLEGLGDQAWARLASFAADADNAAQSDDGEILTDKERSLRLLWHKVLNVGIEAIHSRSAFLQLGGDSISAMQLVSSAGAAGLRLTMQDATKSRNLREMANAATRRNIAGGPQIPGAAGLNEDADSAVEDVLFELSPIQRLYFRITPAGNNAFEQSMLLKLTTIVPVSTLSNALHTLVKHHAQLRARYAHDSGSWKQYISKFDPTQQILRVHNIDDTASIPRIVSESQLRLDFQKGPTFAAELTETRNDQYLFLIAHHLSIDLVSWRVILQDLEDLVLGRADSLPRSSMSFQAWVDRQAEYSQQLEPSVFLQQQQRLQAFDAAKYWGLEHGFSNTSSDVSQQSFVLDKATSSSLLRDSNTAFNTKPVDIFLAAVVTSFARVFLDRDPPTVFLEGHGREPWSASIEILRTVGWFTTLFPVSLDRDEARDMTTAVRLAKDRRSRFLDNGFASFTCSQLLPLSSPESSAAAAPGAPVAEIMLNFAGHFAELENEDGLFKPAGIDLSAHDKTSSQDLFSLFGIEVGVHQGEIRFDVSYHSRSQKRDLITRWIDDCKSCLQEAAAILPTLPRNYTAGDFPLLQLSSDEELDILLTDTLPSLAIDIGTMDDIFKCTPTQLDMLDTEERAVGHHMTRLDFEVTGTTSGESIDPIRLGEAFETLVARHPILRTAFVPTKSSGFVQVVLNRHTPAITHVKVNGNEEFGGAAPPTDKVYQKLQRGEPPYHLTLHHLVAQDKVFLSWELSHALLDGNSIAILLRDWNLAYVGQLSDGTAPSFQNLVRYTAHRASEPALAYWTQQLTGIQPCLLPLNASSASGDHHPTATRQQRFIPLRLPTLDALQRFCQDTVVTVPNLVHAAWAIALRRALPGSPDVVFGYLVSGRDVPLVDSIGDAAGPYFNTVLSRYDLNTITTLTLGDVLRTVQAAMTVRLPFQNFSWPEVRERLVGVLDPPLPAGPVYNTIINIHRFAALDDAGVESRLRFEGKQGYDPLLHDMELTGKIDTEDIRLALVYWSTSFTHEFASALAASVEDIVREMLSNLDSPVEGSK
ncbi:acetyl-CoA synthetase-like protein [Penicillium sp. CMV-2018d]|nr:acetyl-CoA synthetase-like protein [Penicillium sp. CMV-2018d]